MTALHEVQRAFGAWLLGREHDAPGWASGDDLPVEARLRVYRNNSRALFEQALQLTYPVLWRRVGADYFLQLSHHYRDAHPSRCGDLHEVGRAFPGFLATHLGGGPYAWLAELALLEWSVADAGVAAEAPAAAAAALAELAPECVASARFTYVPSLRLARSSVPVLSIWRANQPDGDGRPIDLASGGECVLVHRNSVEVELRSLEPAEFAFVEATARGATLGEAIDAAALPLDVLPTVLHRLFADGAIAAVV
jgi:hypothetical protein